MMSNHTAGFQSVFHIWSTKRNIQPHVVQHAGVHIYNDKVAGGVIIDSDVYANVKRKYISGRGIPWNLSNKKYRETLQELEELLERQIIACISWKNTQAVQFILSNATLVSINISCESPDIARIFIDKTLVKKLPDYISDAIIEEHFMIYSFLEKLQIVLVNFSSKLDIGEWREGDRLNTFEPKFSFVDLPGPTGFRVKKNCLCNKHLDLVCVWWAFSSEEALSWSPSSKDINRSNVVWLSLTGISSVFTVDVTSHMRTDGDLLDAVFSNGHPHQLLTVEQSQSSSTKYLIDACTYELVGKKVCKIDCTTIATKGDVICQSRNYIQNKLILVCRNGSLVLWDEYKRTPHTTKTSFIPSHVTWHPNDFIFLLSNKYGDIQVFDIGLNCLSLQLLSDTVDTCEYLRLSQYFFSQPNLQLVSWAQDSGVGPAPHTICCCDDVMLIFERGPICVLRLQLGICTQGSLSPVQLVCEYIKYDQLKEAVILLNSMHWNNCSFLCFQCLILITDYIFKLPFNASREECLENTLGSFYAPTQALLEDVILQYRDDVSRVARRFFHHLLRHKRFKKAFLLAVDIGSKDLFMDIHYLALDIGDHELAEASSKRAFDIHSKETDNLEIPSDSIFDKELKNMYPNLNQMSISSTPKVEPLHPLQKLSGLTPSYEPQKFEFEDSYEELKHPPGAWSVKKTNHPQQFSDTLSISSSMSKKKLNTYVDSFGEV